MKKSLTLADPKLMMPLLFMEVIEMMRIIVIDNLLFLIHDVVQVYLFFSK
jgi:hypothetical protein